MEWGKAKSILIALMLAVNILLGVNIGVQLYERHKSQNETARMACQILLEQGVTAGEDMLLTMPDAMIGYIYSRDTAVEEAAASALLGDCLRQEPGGGIYTYTSQAGELTFRSGGYIELGWQGDDAPDMDGLLSHAGGPELRTVGTGEGEWMLYVGSIPVYGASVSGEGGAYSGSWIFGKQSGTEQQSLSLPAMILAVGRVMQARGVEKIDSVDPAYILSAMQNGDVRLTPVWRVESGRQSFYISVLSGEETAF